MTGAIMTMSRAVRILIASVALAASCASYAPAQTRLLQNDIGESDLIPPPRLIEPSTDVVDLRGGDDLVFRWSGHEGDPVRRQYYDFRLYKGRQAFGQYLILKTRVEPRTWSVRLDQGIFENGADYTCALRQVYIGAKSRRTFRSFKVIK